MYASSTSEAVHSPAAICSTMSEADIVIVDVCLLIQIRPLRGYLPEAFRYFSSDDDGSEADFRATARSATFISATRFHCEDEKGHILLLADIP